MSAAQGNIKFGLLCLRFDKGGEGGDAVDCNMLSFLIFTSSPVHPPPLAQPVWEIIFPKSRCFNKNTDGAFFKCSSFEKKKLYESIPLLYIL